VGLVKVLRNYLPYVSPGDSYSPEGWKFHTPGVLASPAGDFCSPVGRKFQSTRWCP